MYIRIYTCAQARGIFEARKDADRVLLWVSYLIATWVRFGVDF